MPVKIGGEPQRELLELEDLKFKEHFKFSSIYPKPDKLESDKSEKELVAQDDEFLFPANPSAEAQEEKEESPQYI